MQPYQSQSYDDPKVDERKDKAFSWKNGNVREVWDKMVQFVKTNQ